MKRHMGCMVIALGLVGCGLADPGTGELRAAITWGEKDTANAYPNVGGMVVTRASDGSKYPICSGTLIHPRLFLTAGHCTDAYITRVAQGRYTNLEVSFDADLAAPVNLLEVSQVISHPQYKWVQNDPHDVGIIVLSAPVTGITPATLPPLGLLGDLRAQGKLRSGGKATQFTVVGYGGTLEWPPPHIFYEDQRQIAQSSFWALLPAQLLMNQNPATGNGGTCYGDSGGPAFWKGPGSPEYLVGITSWGDMQCIASGFDYRVDIAQTLDFIEAVKSTL